MVGEIPKIDGKTVSLLKVTFALFLITNPIGNTPAILAILRGIPPERQRIILFRESIFALLLAFAFLYAGKGFMNALGLQNYTVSLCGGVLLLIVSHKMIFPHHENDFVEGEEKKEPMLVPIATPLLMGGGLLTAILLYQQRTESTLLVATALVIEFIFVTFLLVLAPTLNRLLKKKGLYALEQLMGIILSMLAIEMLVNGTRTFLQTHGAS